MRSYFLITKRIGFSLWQEDDLAFAKSLWCNGLVTKFISAQGTFTAQEVQERLSKEIAGQKNFGVQYWPIFSVDTDAFIGCCGLRPYELEKNIYEIGFHLLPDFWGQGLASEAALAVIDYAWSQLKAEGLFAGHHPSNLASGKTLSKLGFVYTHDEFYKPTGLYHPSYCLNGAT